MTDCALTSPTAPRHRRLAAWFAASLLGLAASGGCVFGPDGRPLGARSVDALTHIVNGSGACACHSRHHPAHRRSSCHACATAPWDDYSEQAIVDCGDGCCLPADGGGSMDEFDEASSGIPCDAPCGEEVYGPPEYADPEYADSDCGPTRCRWYEPGAGALNFCAPPASIGALPPPPPGRFFPVPTRPVFTPLTAVPIEPTGW